MTVDAPILWAVLGADLVLTVLFLYVLMRSVLPAMRRADENQVTSPDRAEEPILMTVRSPWVEAHPVLFAVLTTIAGVPIILLAFRIIDPGWLTISLAAFLGHILLWLYRFVRRLEITPSRLLVHTGFPTTTMSAVDLQNIVELELTQESRNERRQGLHTLTVTAGDEPGRTVAFPAIPEAEKVVRFIQMRHAMAERGISQ